MILTGVLLLSLFLGVPYSFESESIVVTLDSARIAVEGEYTFRNITGEKVEAYLYYPFPLDSCDYPDEIVVENADFSFAPEGIRLSFPIEPEGRKCIKIRYVQRLKSTYARYILRSTRSWGRPLEEAYYSVSMPRIWRKIYISIPLDRVEVKGRRRIFFGKFSDFMPETDLIVKWKYRSAGATAEDSDN